MSSSKSIDGSCGATFPADSDNLPDVAVVVAVEILALVDIALALVAVAVVLDLDC